MSELTTKQAETVANILAHTLALAEEVGFNEELVRAVVDTFYEERKS